MGENLPGMLGGLIIVALGVVGWCGVPLPLREPGVGWRRVPRSARWGAAYVVAGGLLAAAAVARHAGAGVVSMLLLFAFVVAIVVAAGAPSGAGSGRGPS